MNVALVNTNRIKPPIAPIGLEYVAEALNAVGHHVEVIDLCWPDDWSSDIAHFLDKSEYGLIGITLRNTDDCAFTIRQSFLNEFANIVSEIRNQTNAPIVLGGVGFSTMPEQVLQLCPVDAGVWGDGEFVFSRLADRIEKKQKWDDLPNLIWRRDDRWYRNPPSTPSLENLPPMSRRWVDNRRYFREGGQLGIETKRGCPASCIYCADPIAKGKQVRARPPQAVADELEKLLEQGIDHIHTCDSEFNIPQRHAIEVCREIVRRGLGDKLRWYAYCSPGPFSPDLARLMRRAGCVGINFGVDSGDGEILRRLRRDFSPEDILNATRACKEAGMAVILDLLLGSPGETEESIVGTIELIRKAAPDRVGASVGVRVYPGTELANLVTQLQMKEGLVGGSNPSEPLFFLEPEVSSFIFQLLDKLIGDDNSFFFFDASRPKKNYNYNANQRLIDAIREGYRGAYWDILAGYE